MKNIYNFGRKTVIKMAVTGRRLWQIFSGNNETQEMVYSGSGETVSYEVNANTDSGDARYVVSYRDNNCEFSKIFIVPHKTSCSGFPSYVIIERQDEPYSGNPSEMIDGKYPCASGVHTVSVASNYSAYTYAEDSCGCSPIMISRSGTLSGVVSMESNHEIYDDKVYEGYAIATIDGYQGSIWYRLVQGVCPCFERTEKRYGEMEEPVTSSVSCVEQAIQISGYVPCSSVTTYWDESAQTCVSSETTSPELRVITVNVSVNPFGGDRLLSGITDRVWYEITQESCTDCNETTYEYEETAVQNLGNFSCIAQTTSITADVKYTKRTSYIDPNTGECKEGVGVTGVSAVTITVYIAANMGEHSISQQGVTDYVRWKYTQDPCSDCTGTTYEYGQASISVFTKTVSCSAQTVEISGDLEYTAITKSLNVLDGSCTSSQTVGTSAITSSVEIDANETTDPIVKSGMKDLIRYELTQESCIVPCETGTVYTYDYTTVQPFTVTITCLEQDVQVTGSVHYTAVTTYIDDDNTCVTAELVGVSGVTGIEPVHFSKNDGGHTITRTGSSYYDSSHYIMFTITQSSCDVPCETSVTYSYDSVFTSLTVSCLEQDVSISAQIPYTATTTHEDCTTDTFVDTSGVTETVHIPRNDSDTYTARTGMVGHIQYIIKQNPCSAPCQSGISYIYSSVTVPINASCLEQDISFSVQVPYTAITANTDCSTQTSVNTSGVTQTIHIPSNDGDSIITRTGTIGYVNYKVYQSPCESPCEYNAAYVYETVNTSLTATCQSQNIVITAQIPYTATITHTDCSVETITGTSGVTKTFSIPKNTSNSVVTRTGTAGYIHYTINQDPCQQCEYSVTYEYTTVSTSTTSTCLEQDVNINAIIPYTATVTHTDCTTETSTGTSGVTETVHIPKNTGNTIIARTGTVGYINYTINQNSCQQCEYSVTYNYTSVSTSMTANCFEQDIVITAQIPYTATITHTDCSVEISGGTSGVTQTVHIPKNTGDTVTARTGSAGYINYTISQDPCEECEGTDYTYANVSRTVSANCLAQTVLIEADVPYTAVTHQYVDQVCTSITSYGTSAVTIAISITKNETNDVVPWTGVENYIQYTINQEPCLADNMGWFTTEALTSGRFELIVRPNDDYLDEYISYSRDGGESWTRTEVWTLGDYTTVALNVNKGDKIYWKGNVHVLGRDQSYGDIEACSQFSGSCDYKIYGNLMSFFYEDNIQEIHSDFKYRDYACAYLFRYDGHLKSANYLYLPELDISEGCYQGLFYECTGLTAVSKDLLPAPIVKPMCYLQMFAGCSSLEVAPVLPSEHFLGAFEAPACYNEMFSGCSSLNYIQFHALDKVECQLYYQAEYTLDWVKGVAANGVFCIQTDAEIYTNKSTWHSWYDNAIPSGWEVTFIASESDYLITTPIDDTTNFYINIGSNVGTSNISSISFSTDSGSTWTTSAYTGADGFTVTVLNVQKGNEVWWYGVGKSYAIGVDDASYYSRFHTDHDKRFVVRGNMLSMLKGPGTPSDTTLERESTFYKFFSNSAVFDASQLVLPSTSLTDSCYEYMFQGCTRLVYGGTSVMPAATVPVNAYHGMYAGCTSMKYPSVPLMKISATTAGDNAFAAMFSGCTALDAYSANIELDCQTTAEQSFMDMFRNCTSIEHMGERFYIKSRNLTHYAYSNMFTNCTSLVSTPPISARTASDMTCEPFRGFVRDCTSLMYFKYYSQTLGPETGLTNMWYGNLQQDGYFIVRNDTTWTPEDYRFGYISPFVSDAGVPKRSETFWTIEKRGDIDWQWP